jgi:ribosome-binding factor A
MSRVDKVNHQVQKEIAKIIQDELDNPNIGLVSIVGVRTTPDLRQSKVYFSVFPVANIEIVEESLFKMKGFIRRILAKNLSMRVVPELTFIKDETINYSMDISEKIADLN